MGSQNNLYIDRFQNDISLLNIYIFALTLPILNKNYLTTYFLSHEFSQEWKFAVQKQSKERIRGKKNGIYTIRFRIR